MVFIISFNKYLLTEDQKQKIEKYLCLRENEKGEREGTALGSFKVIIDELQVIWSRKPEKSPRNF